MVGSISCIQSTTVIPAKANTFLNMVCCLVDGLHLAVITDERLSILVLGSHRRTPLRVKSKVLVIALLAKSMVVTVFLRDWRKTFQHAPFLA